MRSHKNNTCIALLFFLAFFGNNLLLQAQNLLPFKLNNLWGYKNKQGLVVVEPKYIAISKFTEGMAGVAILVGEKYIQGFINEEGTEVVPVKYAGTWPFSEGLAAFAIESNGYKWGYLDKTGKVIIEAQYSEAKSFTGGKALVTLNGKSFYIDKTGKEIPSTIVTTAPPSNAVNTQVQELEIFSVVTGTDENAVTKYGFKDGNGNIVVTAKYDEIMNFDGFFVSGLQAVRIDQKWAFIDKTGKEVIPMKYNNTGDFSEGLARVNIGSCCYVPMSIQTGGKWGYIDKTGKVVIQLKYDYAGDFKEGIAYVKKLGPGDNFTEGKYALINKAGLELTPFKYTGMGTCSEGMFMVYINDKFGFINKTGKEVIPLTYENAYEFSEGLAPVKLNGKWGFVDKTGKMVIPIEFENSNYLYGFIQGVSPAKKNGKFGFIDKTGKEVVAFIYDEMKSYSQDRAAVKLNNKWGFVDLTGKKVIEIKYDKVSDFNYSSKKAKVMRDGDEYEIDTEGKETLTKAKIVIKPVDISLEAYSTAVIKDDPDAIDIMIKNGLNINEFTASNQFNGLYLALDKSKDKVVFFLINNGFDLKKTGSSERTALHYTCNRYSAFGMDKIALATLLLKKGVNINALDGNGETALHIAADADNFELVEFLLKNGADPKIKNKFYNLTALDRAKNNKNKAIIELLKNYKESVPTY